MGNVTATLISYTFQVKSFNKIFIDLAHNKSVV